MTRDSERLIVSQKDLDHNAEDYIYPKPAKQTQKEQPGGIQFANFSIQTGEHTLRKYVLTLHEAVPGSLGTSPQKIARAKFRLVTDENLPGGTS